MRGRSAPAARAAVDSVPALDYDLAMFTSGAGFPPRRRGDRLAGLLLGQIGKEIPPVLALAMVTFPVSRLPGAVGG
ncbi:hypothetical protein KZ829_15235 [Actinoplanes hulinensis]|uniref:Uncharacterized protein n=1 Tax=Actinoplanes hulinensis TaxID=1144547 RepID=A0ABS7B297_9ACTN|nr:hypothetical protein [Actinoplanes hulinensis]MBW6435095.1 hypothetical protein [Actinoplanes hulinensis]